ncbi:hypothetical protein TSUD_63730 [Trifolium subterraneum]|uniref:CCHC-type domain-containing protein n=1 Tax=Trifolium subterraneum TaxID=3900 RepID=A0A2Z6MGE8_TRISU|nr:hypothetical protein TSUD_63730 [Trifolium subterraneum]
MKEDESVHDFYMNVMDFANSFDDLGEKMSDEKIVRKILRSLTKKFDMKVIAMEEAQDISTMRVDELIGSLQTYESSVNERIERKNKSIAFVSNAAEEDEEDEQDSGESFSEAIVMLGRQFSKVLRKADKNSWKGAKNNASDIMRSIDAQKKSKGDEKPTVNKRIQCHECEGYGHIRTECGTYLRNQKKSLVALWFDEEEFEGEKEFEATKHVRVLTGILESDTESSDEELTFEELETTYKELCLVSVDKCREIEKLKKINSQLKADQAKNMSRIEELQIKVNHLTSDLDEANKEIDLLNVNVGRLRKYSEMLNKTGDEKFDEILEHHKRRPRFAGISYENVNKLKTYNPDLMYTHPKEVQGANMSRKVPQRPRQHHGNSYHKKHRPWRCHYCGKKGHIRPFCYKLYGYPHEKQQTKPKPVIQKEWKLKSENVTIKPKVDEDLTENQVTGMIAHTSFRASSKEDWYFDSGCSRHMTGDDRFLVDIKSYSTSYVTFGDGAKGEIIGVGKLISKSLPKLKNVFLVKGLTANLISICQLCDQGLKVNFTKTECLVTSESDELLMKGVRSKDNCYLWVSQEEANLSTCLIAKEDEVTLWHQKLGHLNLRSMKKVISEEAIRGLPQLKIVEGNICGECQIGKQTKMPHKMLQHSTTTRVFELLHMDLMGPMQVESLGGKKYADVVVDDFSRYTWINFIKEKSDTFDIFKDLCVQLQREKDNVNVVGTKWVYKNKSDENGVVTRNKVRLVAQGYAQIEGIDFDETFAPVARLESIRLLLGVACILKFKLFQMDVKSAFLNGYLNEEVFVEQTKGFNETTLLNHVYKLKKAPYGLKQAPRAWYERLTEFLLSQGYRKGGNDKILFVKEEEEKSALLFEVVPLQIPMFDELWRCRWYNSSSVSEQGRNPCCSLSEHLANVQPELQMLYMSVERAGGCLMYTTAGIRGIRSKIMDGGNHKRTPAATHLKLTKDETRIDVDQSLYRSMIGSLLYLTASRPDITFAVGVCARYEAQPKMSHLVQVKRILKYVNGTCDYGILYCHSENFTLVGYCDADWVGSADDRKSTSGTCFFLGNNLISWFSKKQNSVSLSTAEAEYIAAGSSCSQLLWMKQMLKEYNVEQDVMPLYCDNLSAINISKNPIQHSRTKHIDIRHHFIRDLAEDKIVTLEHVGTEEQLADIFTTALDVVQFEKLRGKLEDDLWGSSLMCLTNSKEDDNVKNVGNPNVETVKDSETLGLAKPSCIEKLGKTGPSCFDPPTVGVGTLLEAKSDSVLEHDKKNAPEEDAAHNARQPTNILTRNQIIADLTEVSRILGEKKGMVDLVVHTLEDEKTEAACAGIEGTSSIIPHVTEDDADDVGGDTEVEEEHSDASPLVCSA